MEFDQARERLDEQGYTRTNTWSLDGRLLDRWTDDGGREVLVLATANSTQCTVYAAAADLFEEDAD